MSKCARHLPRPLGTLFWTLLAVSGLAFGALAVEIVQWLTASPWNMALTILLVGTVVMASRALQRVRQRAHHAVRPEVTAGARPSPRMHREPVYYGKQRVGWTDEAGTVHLDKAAR